MKKAVKTNKEAPKAEKKDRQLGNRAMGIFQLFVVGSIGFMSYIVFMGMQDPVSQALTIPALLWAGGVLVQRFTK